ncbi:MAG: hypothetical protein WC201_04265, partial [Bacilli bacterium]
DAIFLLAYPLYAIFLLSANRISFISSLISLLILRGSSICHRKFYYQVVDFFSKENYLFSKIVYSNK